MGDGNGFASLGKRKVNSTKVAKRFVHADPIDMAVYGGTGTSYTAAQILQHLAPRLTPERWAKIQKVVANRTCDVSAVLENIYDRGNTSAVMRSAEAMGFQNIHLIEPGDRFKESNRVTAGADKWLDVVRFRETEVAIEHLKSRGYKILATHLDAKAKPLESMDLTAPIAIVFGNEKDGISPEMQKLADQTVILPMRGFVQSYNISVAAAIAFQAISSARDRAGTSGTLNGEERRLLEAHYVLRTLDNSADLMRRLA
jgi:tRNA (guanosine-2'-O-)-methyltransferase